MRQLQDAAQLAVLAWSCCCEAFMYFEANKLPFWPWITMEEGIRLVHELGMR